MSLILDNQDLQESKESNRKSKKNKIFVFITLVIVFSIALFFLISTGYLLDFIFGFIFCLYEVLLICPLCLVLSNQKNFDKTKFITLLVLGITCSAILTYFCFWINKYPSLANFGFWFLLFWYLIISVSIIKSSSNVKKEFTFNIFKKRISTVLFILFSLSYLSYSTIFSDFIEYYQKTFFINNEIKLRESARKVDYCHINNVNFKYDEKGAVLVDGEPFSDYCLDSKTLMEQWCMRDPKDSAKYYYGTEEHTCDDACLDGKCVPFSVINQPFNVNLSLSSTSIYNLFDVKLIGTDERASEYKLRCKSGAGEYRLVNNFNEHFYTGNILAISDTDLSRNLIYTCYVEACLIDNCSTSNELTFIIDSNVEKREVVAE